MSDLVASRLRAQRLAGTRFADPVEAVRWFGAVQSQDYPAAKWALGLRMNGATEDAIDRLYDEGGILRTHVLRPTWHFVDPEDIRWMLELTGPKIHQGMAGRYRQLELDAGTIARALKAFARALAGGRHLTRGELGETLAASGISPEGQRLPHLLASGELTGLVTSGRRRGRQHTYALLEERAPRSRRLDREESIGELARRYFVSHGPAQLRDFVWWSGLTVAEARRGIAVAGAALERRQVEGLEYWSDARLGSPRPPAPSAHLLPNFDEYTVGYADRSAMLHPTRPFRPELFSFASVLANVVTIGGRVCGSWRRVAARDRMRVEIRALAELPAAERALVTAAAARLSRFLGRGVDVAWS